MGFRIEIAKRKLRAEMSATKSLGGSNTVTPYTSRSESENETGKAQAIYLAWQRDPTSPREAKVSEIISSASITKTADTIKLTQVASLLHTFETKINKIAKYMQEMESIAGSIRRSTTPTEESATQSFCFPRFWKSHSKKVHPTESTIHLSSRDGFSLEEEFADYVQRTIDQCKTDVLALPIKITERKYQQMIDAFIEKFNEHKNRPQFTTLKDALKNRHSLFHLYFEKCRIELGIEKEKPSQISRRTPSF